MAGLASGSLRAKHWQIRSKTNCILALAITLGWSLSRNAWYIDDGCSHHQHCGPVPTCPFSLASDTAVPVTKYV